jgi:hypothetical protein
VYPPKKVTITPKSLYEKATRSGKSKSIRINTLNTTTQNTLIVSYTVNFLITEKTGTAAATTSASYMPKSGESGTAVQNAVQGRIKNHITCFRDPLSSLNVHFVFPRTS